MPRLCPRMSVRCPARTPYCVRWSHRLCVAPVSHAATHECYTMQAVQAVGDHFCAGCSLKHTPRRRKFPTAGSRWSAGAWAHPVDTSDPRTYLSSAATARAGGDLSPCPHARAVRFLDFESRWPAQMQWEPWRENCPNVGVASAA